MRRSRPGRLVLFAVLAAAVLVNPAPLRAASLLDRLWSALTGVWAEAGCIIDPNGGCGASPAAPGTDEGCIIDPHGGCAAVLIEPPAPAPTPDEGCILDPHGGCAPRS